MIQKHPADAIALLDLCRSTQIISITNFRELELRHHLKVIIFANEDARKNARLCQGLVAKIWGNNCPAGGEGGLTYSMPFHFSIMSACYIKYN